MNDSQMKQFRRVVLRSYGPVFVILCLIYALLQSLLTEPGYVRGVAKLYNAWIRWFSGDMTTAQAANFKWLCICGFAGCAIWAFVVSVIIAVGVVEGHR